MTRRLNKQPLSRRRDRSFRPVPCGRDGTRLEPKTLAAPSFEVFQPIAHSLTSGQVAPTANSITPLLLAAAIAPTTTTDGTGVAVSPSNAQAQVLGAPPQDGGPGFQLILPNPGIHSDALENPTRFPIDPQLPDGGRVDSEDTSDGTMNTEADSPINASDFAILPKAINQIISPSSMTYLSELDVNVSHTHQFTVTNPGNYANSYSPVETYNNTGGPSTISDVNWHFVNAGLQGLPPMTGPVYVTGRFSISFSPLGNGGDDFPGVTPLGHALPGDPASTRPPGGTGIEFVARGAGIDVEGPDNQTGALIVTYPTADGHGGFTTVTQSYPDFWMSGGTVTFTYANIIDSGGGEAIAYASQLDQQFYPNKGGNWQSQLLFDYSEDVQIVP
jgi:hypothetical protein